MYLCEAICKNLLPAPSAIIFWRWQILNAFCGVNCLDHKHFHHFQITLWFLNCQINSEFWVLVIIILNYSLSSISEFSEFISSWRCTCCKNVIRLAYYSGLKRAGKEVGSTQTLWMEDEQRHFVCNWMASAWLNVTHDECHGFFCPFQIAIKQSEGLGSYAQPWWNSCLIPDLFCSLQPASKFIVLPLYHTVAWLFLFYFLNHTNLLG